MNTHADKTQENKSQSISNGESQMQGGGGATFQFVDNRPETIAQGKLQEIANNRSQAMQLRAFQDMANNSLQARQATQLQAMADNYSAHQQQPIQKKENNTSLPDNLKTGMENLSGISLDDVKVHRNSDKPAQLQAHAYAQGTDIHLGPGQEKHLPHEAWHVVQQKQGRVKPTVQMTGKVNVNDDARLEQEADVMGAKALSLSFEAGEVQQFKAHNVSAVSSVYQLKDYADKFSDEKTEILKRLKELQFAGISSLDAGSFTWHHKFPHSKLKDTDLSRLKDSRNYLALGPNPEARVKGDDPGNEGVDLNYTSRSEEQTEPISPRISRKLFSEHEKHGFDDLFSLGISKTESLKDEGAIRSNVSLEEVIEDWNQWYIPGNGIKEIGTEKELKAACESADLKKALTEADDKEFVGDVFKEAARRIQKLLTEQLHEYTYYERPDSPGKKFAKRDETGVPVTMLTPENIGAFHGILDTILKSRQNWLRRGSKGDSLDEEKKELAKVDIKKYGDENVKKIIEKFNPKEAIDLIERTKIAPQSFGRIADEFDRFHLGRALSKYTDKNPITKPDDVRTLHDDAEFFALLEKDLIVEIEKVLKEDDNPALIHWCAEHLPELEKGEPGDLIEELKEFIKEYERVKEEGPEDDEDDTDSEPDVPEVKLTKKDRRRLRDQTKKSEREDRKAKNRASKKRGNFIKKKVVSDSDDDTEDDVVEEEYIPDLEDLLEDNDHISTLFSAKTPKEKKHCDLISSLLLAKKKDYSMVHLPQEIVDYLKDKDDKEDGEFDTGDIDPWKPEEIKEEVPEDERNYDGEERAKYDVDEYERFFGDKEDAGWEKLAKQREIGELDLTELYDEQGLDENVIGMLAMKAHMHDILFNNPKKQLQKKGQTEALAKNIIAEIKPRLKKRQASWAKKLENNSKVLNTSFLETKIKDLMHFVKPRSKEPEEDFMKRVQDEVSLALVTHLEAQASEAFAIGTGKSKSKPNEARSGLMQYLDGVLPGVDLREDDGIVEEKAKVIEHLKTYIDPWTKEFNVSLWKDVRGQTFARLDSRTEGIYKEVEKEFIANGGKAFEEKEVKKGEKEVKKAEKEVKAKKEPVKAANLPELINTQDNPGGGDCLFYALSGSNVAEQAQLLRARIAQHVGAVSSHELITLLNETPGLSRYAYRVLPAIEAGNQEDAQAFNVDAVYRSIIQTQGTWGGRREILTSSALGDGSRIAVVEIEGGEIESITVYDNGVAGRVLRFPSLEELRDELEDATIIVHRGGNHWVRATLSE